MLPVIVGKEHEIDPWRLREGEWEREAKGQDWTSLLCQLFSCITDSVCLLCCCSVHIVSFCPLFSFLYLSSPCIVFSPSRFELLLSQIPDYVFFWWYMFSSPQPSSSFKFPFSAIIVGLYVCTPLRESQAHVFPLQPSSLCSPGHSRSDLFYVSSVLIVTQPEVCSKTHRLMFSPSNPLHNFSLSFLPLSLFPPLNLFLSLSLFFPLRETFGSMEQFQNHLWDCVMWCRRRMLIGLSERTSFSHSGVPQQSLSFFQCCYRSGCDSDSDSYVLGCGL